MKKVILQIVFVVIVATFISSVELKNVLPWRDVQKAYWTNNLNNEKVTRIVNGQIAIDGQFPYQIRLLQYGRQNCTALDRKCGGSIIAKNWILTAAHCITLMPGSLDTILSFEIQAGELIPDEPRQRRIVLFADAFTYPDYDKYTSANDIGLIKLSTPLNFRTPFVKPIALVAADTDKASYVGQTITVSGYGFIENDGQLAPELRYTNMTVMDYNDCYDNYLTNDGVVIPDAVFCTEDLVGKSASCSGDSGGPVTMIIDGELKQIGIVSFGSYRGCNNAPDVFTNVAQFIPWINEIMTTYGVHKKYSIPN